MEITKVYHVEFQGQHSYFGSKKAIFQHFTKEQLGITYSSFRNVKNLKNIAYDNGKCIIREGILEQATNSEKIK